MFAGAMDHDLFNFPYAAPSPAPMVETFLLVDFENVRDIALSKLNEGFRVKVFLGRSQKCIPTTMVAEAQHLGTRLEWIRIAGDGRNNLDFHLSYHLGRLMAEHPEAAFVIITNDKGFDPLIEHVSQSGRRVVRDATYLSSRLQTRTTDEPKLDRVCSLLSKINTNSRPGRRKTLAKFIAAHLQKKEPDAEVNKLVTTLLAKRVITEDGNALSYHL